MMNMIHRQRTSRRSTRGAALLEALVAVLIFVIGVLGIVGLQVSMTRAQSASKFRADAAALANELIGVLWVDQPNMAKYTIANCDTHARCLDWKNKVASALPGGTVEVLDANVGTGKVDVTVSWTVPNEGSHRYATSTNVQ